MLLLDNFTPLVLSSLCFSREAQNKLGEIKDERLLQEDFFFFFFPTVSCSSLFRFFSAKRVSFQGCSVD